EHPPHFLAQVSTGGPGKERIHARAGVEDGPLACLALGASSRSGGLALGRGQAGEVLLVLEQDHLGSLFLEYVLSKFRVEHRQLLVQLRKLGFGGVVELCARPDESGVVQPEQALLLGTELQLTALRINCVYAREELAVLDNAIGERN